MVHLRQPMAALLGNHGRFRVGRLPRPACLLAGILDSRGYPVARLARDLEIAADVTAGKGDHGARPPPHGPPLRRSGCTSTIANALPEKVTVALAAHLQGDSLDVEIERHVPVDHAAREVVKAFVETR